MWNDNSGTVYIFSNERYFINILKDKDINVLFVNYGCISANKRGMCAIFVYNQ